MKKIIVTSFLLLSFTFASLPVLAIGNQVPPQGNKQLKTQLLKVRHVQAVTKTKIKKNIKTAKTHLKQIKKKRTIEKKRRNTIRKKAGKPLQ